MDLFATDSVISRALATPSVSPLALARPVSAQPMALAPPLKLGTSGPDAAQIEKTAREFESVFAKMLITSMRQASFGDALFPTQNETFKDMYDQQLAKSLSSGPGLGLAPVIARQLSQQTAPVDATAASNDEPKPFSLNLTPNAAADTNATPPALGSYHRPATQQTPAWLAGNDAKPLANGHFDLNRGSAVSRSAGPDETASTVAAGTDHFVLTPPIPTAPAASPARLRSASPEEFVAKIWPEAQRAGAELGVDPKMLVAQAALETGWGRHVVGRQKDGSGGNLFGIKAGGRWSGAAQNAATHEFVNGQATAQRANFRAYGSVAESFDDYVGLLKNNDRYADALGSGSDRQRFANALSKAGYATDPYYANKLVAIADGPTLRRALAGLNPEPHVAANSGAGTQLAALLMPAME